MNKIQNNVLVLDADMVPCMTVARSLKKTGIKVHVAGHTAKPITSASNSISELFTYPDPLNDEKAFTEWLYAHLQKYTYDLIIPVTERTILPIKKYRRQFSDLNANFAMASDESLDIVLDKTKTVALARQLHIPVPAGQTITHVEQLNEIDQNFTFPVVLKPSRSIGSGKKSAVPLTVEYAVNAESLKSKASNMLQFGEVILQEFFQGKGVGIEIIADQGRIRYFFQHERIHEVPLTGGGSSLRKGVKIIPGLKAATIKIIKALNWHGVAMVEFKYDPVADAFAFMEINGRLWGSLPLAVASGADFPKMLYELFVKGKINNYPEPKTGIVCRKLSRDIYWHEMVLRKLYQPEVVQLPKYSTVAKDLALIFNPKHRFDVQSCSDLKPGVLDVWNIISGNLKRIQDIISEKLFFNRQKKIIKSQNFTELLNNAEQILFVCYGNINRSVLAEKIFVKKYTGSSIKCISAGFHKEEGRPADPVMVGIARKRGVDLAGHKSKCLAKNMVDESDVIFVMESKQYDHICKIFPGAIEKIILLGLLIEDGEPEIKDPYGLTYSEYEKCGETISTGIEKICHFI